MMDSEARRFEGGMNRERHVVILRRCEDRVVTRIAVRDAGDRERTYECALATVFHRTFQFARGLGGVAEREVRYWNQAAAGVAAEIRDPAIVSAAICGRQLRVEEFRLPQEADRRIENRFFHPFLLEQLETLLHHHGAERRAFQVSVLGLWRHHPRLLRLEFAAAHYGFAQLLRVLHPLPHSTERTQQPGLRHLCAFPIDFEILAAIVTDADSHRAIAILRVDVFFPEVGWLEDMSVAIDY